MNEKVMNIKKITLEELKDLNKEADVLNCKAKYLGPIPGWWAAGSSMPARWPTCTKSTVSKPPAT